MAGLVGVAGCSLTYLDGFSGGAVSGGAVDGGAVDDEAAVDGGAVDGSPTASNGEGGADGSSSTSPIQFVQARAANLGGQGTNKISFNSAVQANSAIVIALEYDSTATASISDGTSTAYVPVVGPADDGGSRSYIFASFDVPGGNMELSVSLTGASGTYLLVYLHEYRGVTSFDVGSWKKGTTKGVDGMSTSLTTASANELIFAYGFSNFAVAPGTGFEKRSSFYSNVTEDRLTDAGGQFNATATMVSGTGWKLLAAAFKGP